MPEPLQLTPALGAQTDQRCFAEFGYPLTEGLDELIEGRSYRVQYFERRGMENHVELAGTPYAILLGRLGAELAPSDSCVPLDPQSEPIAFAFQPYALWPGQRKRRGLRERRAKRENSPDKRQFAGQNRDGAGSAARASSARDG